MIIDEVKVKIKAGNGGDGMVAFNKNLSELGPTGGEGGRGGSIYLEGVSNLNALNQFRYKKEWKAESGGRGKTKCQSGADGADITLKVPIGTVIHNLTNGQDLEVIKTNERFCLAHGGRGGHGNFFFRSPKNTTPETAETGRPGESFRLKFELKMIADIGLIGLPNAGKSSLLDALTNAKSKVADYPFTTLEPSLGDYYGTILADIPGLIEGASVGRGLGVRFLRHIERTRVLFHLISAESENLTRDYETIRKELKSYNEKLLAKEEYVFLTKSDIPGPKDLAKKLKSLKQINPNSEAISIYDDGSLEKVKRILGEIARKKSG